MKHFKVGLSLRYKLLFLLVSLPLMSLGSYLFIATDLFQKDKVAYVFDSSATVSRSLATQARMELQASYTALRAIVENFDLEAGDFNSAGKNLFEQNPRVHALILFRRDTSGAYVRMAQLAKPSGESFVADENALTSARQSAIEDAAFIREISSGQAHLAFRLGEREDENHMAIVALTSAEDMLGAFDSRDGIYASFLAKRNGQVAVGRMNVIDADMPAMQGILRAQAREGTAELKLSDGIYLVSYAGVGMGNLVVVSRVDKMRALKAVDVLVAKSLLFFVALIAGTLLVSVLASNKLTSSLRELFEATGKVASGDFSVRVVARSKDEVGGLAESFNWMTSEVARLMSETAEKVRMEGELATVRTVQETLFPAAHMRFGPLNIKGHFEPASECGGDWWSYSRIDNRIFLYIGDATGHGAPAALITSAARSAAAVIESLPNITPAEALTILNRAIHQTSKGSIMMTFFVGCIDLDRNIFTYASASHDPPYLLRRTGEKISKKDIIPLNEANGPRLGDQPNHRYEETSLALEPGDLLFLYTDGILDIQDPSGKKWGERAFLNSLIASANEPVDVEGKIEVIRGKLETFRSGSNLIDDVTMVMCELEKGAA